MSTNHGAAAALKLSMSPGAVKVVDTHAGTLFAHAEVTNNGPEELSVRPLTITMSPGHGCTQKAPTWLRLEAHNTFKLAPGQSHPIGYTVTAAAHQNGSAAVVALAQSADSNAQFKVGGAVGERVILGTGQQQCHAPVAAPPAAPGTPVGLVALVAVLALLLVALVALAARRKIRSGR